MKKNILIPLIIIIIAVVTQGIMKSLNKNSSAELVSKSFLENYPDFEKIKDLVSEKDRLIIESEKKDYLEKLLKLPANFNSYKKTAEVVLSDRSIKIDLSNNDNKIVSLFVVKEKDKWFINLDLSKKVLIDQLLSQIEDAELREDEFEMLSLYKKINNEIPSDFYQEKIEKLEKFISKRKKQEDYKKDIYIDNYKLIGRVLTASIQNKGNEKIKNLKGLLQIVNPVDGSISKEIEITIYEVIPGSFVFGEAILPGYEKKIGLNVESVPEIQKNSVVYISVTSVEFMD